MAKQEVVVNKAVLVEAMADAAKREGLKGATKKAAGVMFDALFGRIETGIASGHNVSISGYLDIEVVPVPEHEARNPQNGETVVVPAGFKLRTRAMSRLKNAAKSL